MRPKCVAVLDTMWLGMVRRAPRYFHISPMNRTGKRLYRWMEGTDYNLVVTNCCKMTVAQASEHGTPDPRWLAENLTVLNDIHLLLICGSVAQSTYALVPEKFKWAKKELCYPHPAWRGWTANQLELVKYEIQAIAKFQGVWHGR